MFIVLKSIAGIDYPLIKSGVAYKTVSLKGGCYLNEVNQDDLNEIRKCHPSFEKAVDEGYIIISETKQGNQTNIDKALQDIKDKQDKSKKNAKAKGVEITEGA